MIARLFSHREGSCSFFIKVLTCFFMSEALPSLIKQQHNGLCMVAKRDKAMPEYSGKVYLQANIKLRKYHPMMISTRFVYKKVKYTSLEQALQHCKAVHFRDFERAQRILNESESCKRNWIKSYTFL